MMVDLCLRRLNAHRNVCHFKDCACKGGQAEGLFRLGWNAAVLVVIKQVEGEYWLSDLSFSQSLQDKLIGKPYGINYASSVGSKKQRNKASGPGSVLGKSGPGFVSCRDGRRGCYHLPSESGSCLCWCHKIGSDDL